MEIFICFGPLLMVGTIIVVFLLAKNESLKAARAAYLASLERLKVDPHNPGLREEVLSLGRQYATVSRGSPGSTIFDEVALMNDINAACARAGTMPAGKPGTDRPSVEARLLSLQQLREKQLITEQEYQERRTRLLDEL
jgi:hypothetical protein